MTTKLNNMNRTNVLARKFTFFPKGCHKHCTHRYVQHYESNAIMRQDRESHTHTNTHNQLPMTLTKVLLVISLICLCFIVLWTLFYGVWSFIYVYSVLCFTVYWLLIVFFSISYWFHFKWLSIFVLFCLHCTSLVDLYCCSLFRNFIWCDWTALKYDLHPTLTVPLLKSTSMMSHIG